jgi:hypothetical protein
LEVKEVRITYLARYGDKGDSREGSANHTKRHQKPMGVTIARKKGISCQLSSGQPGNEKKYPEIN